MKEKKNRRIMEKLTAILVELVGIFFSSLSIYEIGLGGGNPIPADVSMAIGSVLVAFGSLLYAKVIPLFDLVWGDEK